MCIRDSIGPSLFAYLVLCHGGGGARLPRARGAVDLYALPAEQAQCVAAGVVAAFISRRARLRRKPAPPPKPPPPPRVEDDESDADETTCFGGQRQREPGSVEMGELPTLSPLHGALPAADASDAEWP